MPVVSEKGNHAKFGPFLPLLWIFTTELACVPRRRARAALNVTWEQTSATTLMLCLLLLLVDWNGREIKRRKPGSDKSDSDSENILSLSLSLFA